jgi:phytoene synthase
MAALKGERRRALWAVYAFCRAVDDIADGAMPEAEKRRFLADWRRKLERPDCVLSRELAWARAAYGVPLEECEAMIAGMETDSADRLRLATEADLDLYCRRVAGSVGAMSVRIFGAPEAEGFGLELGHTFQLTNILRDVDEDAARERVYIPARPARRRGHPDGPAEGIVRHPGFAAICARLGAQAQAGFARGGGGDPPVRPDRAAPGRRHGLGLSSPARPPRRPRLGGRAPAPAPDQGRKAPHGLDGAGSLTTCHKSAARPRRDFGLSPASRGFGTASRGRVSVR